MYIMHFWEYLEMGMEKGIVRAQYRHSSAVSTIEVSFDVLAVTK